MTPDPAAPFGARLKALREAAGFTQEELATIAGLSVHSISALERGERRRPHPETVRALAAALDLSSAARDALLSSARAAPAETAVDELSDPALPHAMTAILGREREVQALRAWLADPKARLITLTGPGGVGKTRLALEVARAVADEDAGRVVLVLLAALRKAAFVSSAIAEALALGDASAEDLPARARAACADRPTLLILDNFEHVLDASPLVAELLARVPALRLLVTSRAPLHVRGEREFAVGPLALPDASDEQSPADLARCPAVRLFLERVRDVRPDFRLTHDNGPAVAAICRRLDALPLAIELAAPWIKTLPPENLLRRLGQDLLFAAAGPRDLPERQQSINATVAWSYRLLAADEQQAFRRLSVLPGRFPLAAAAAVLAGRDSTPNACDRALDRVASLLDKSLLLRVDAAVHERPLFQMLETVRAYAALELGASGEREEALDGLARYCCRQMPLAADGLLGPSQIEWLDRVRDDLDLYRGAMAWLIESGRPEEAADIASTLLFFWVIRGHATEGLRWYDQIVRLRSLPPAAEARLLAASGMLRYTQGELAPARAALVRARELAAAAGERHAAVQAEHLLGHVEHAAGHAAAARELFTAAADGFRALDVPWGTGVALAGLAWVALAAGHLDQAERLLDASGPPLRQAGPWFRLLTRYVRAVLAVRRGDPDRAIALVRGSLVSIRELHDKFAFVYSLVPLAAAAVLKGDDGWAARILGARDAVTARTGATVVDHSVRDLRERAEREARARLGPSRWARAHAAGRRTSIDALLKEIDRAIDTESLAVASFGA